MRKIVACAVAAVLAAPMAPPASALVLYKSAGVSGGMHVGHDFTACVTLTFAGNETFTGVFTAVAAMYGPATKAATVRSAVPFAATGTWTHCIPGGYHGATAGEGKFTVVADAPSRTEYVEMKECVLRGGVVTCV